MSILPQNSRIDRLAGPPFFPVSIDVLRLDIIHTNQFICQTAASIRTASRVKLPMRSLRLPAFFLTFRF